MRICNWPCLFVAVSRSNLMSHLQRMFPKDVFHEKDKFGLGNSNLLNLS